MQELFLHILFVWDKLKISQQAPWHLILLNFFPLFNYCLLLLILGKAGFDSKISIFFQDYLVDRKTKYL